MKRSGGFINDLLEQLDLDFIFEHLADLGSGQVGPHIDLLGSFYTANASFDEGEHLAFSDAAECLLEQTLDDQVYLVRKIIVQDAMQKLGVLRDIAQARTSIS